MQVVPVDHQEPQVRISNLIWRSRILWANRIPDRRRLMVPTLAPQRARKVRSRLMPSAVAGSSG